MSRRKPGAGWRLPRAENSTDPDVLVAEIADDLRNALEQIVEILGDLRAPDAK